MLSGHHGRHIIVRSILVLADIAQQRTDRVNNLCYHLLQTSRSLLMSQLRIKTDRTPGRTHLVRDSGQRTLLGIGYYFARFINSAYQAIQDVDPSMLAVIHLPNAHDEATARNMFDNLQKYGALAVLVLMVIFVIVAIIALEFIDRDKR